MPMEEYLWTSHQTVDEQTIQVIAASGEACGLTRENSESQFSPSGCEYIVSLAKTPHQTGLAVILVRDHNANSSHRISNAEYDGTASKHDGAGDSLKVRLHRMQVQGHLACLHNGHVPD